jgi:hypothetical protein
VLQRKIPEIEGLARADVDPGDRGAVLATSPRSGMSLALKSWVRMALKAKGVVEVKTFLIPGGVAPFQSAPTSM